MNPALPAPPTRVPATVPAHGTAVVIDTNIALDLLVFEDPGVAGLREALARGRLAWLATLPMREELSRVLGYPRLCPHLAASGRWPQAVLADFDRISRQVPEPLRASVICRDGDDQKFVDLAVANRCLLLSKDRDLLSMKKRLSVFQVVTSSALAAQNSGQSVPRSPL
jgi:putative PIN family toxin of toxin-antitoxin system